MQIRDRASLPLLCSLLTLASVLTSAQSVNNQPLPPQEKYKQGHSRHGEAYDQGSALLHPHYDVISRIGYLDGDTKRFPTFLPTLSDILKSVLIGIKPKRR